MVLLEGSIHKLKVDFNTKIQDLKQRKKDTIARVAQMNGRVRYRSQPDRGSVFEAVLPVYEPELQALSTPA